MFGYRQFAATNILHVPRVVASCTIYSCSLVTHFTVQVLVHFTRHIGRVEFLVDLCRVQLLESPEQDEDGGDQAYLYQ